MKSSAGGGKLTAEYKQFLRSIEVNPLQKTALDKMLDVFKTSGISYKFVHVNGHQKTAEVGSDGYWNKRADRASKKGRVFGEALAIKERICSIEDIAKDIVVGDVSDDWRSRVQVPFVQVKAKDKTQPIKVKRHRKSNEDAYNIRIMLNVRIKIR